MLKSKISLEETRNYALSKVLIDLCTRHVRVLLQSRTGVGNVKQNREVWSYVHLRTKVYAYIDIPLPRLLSGLVPASTTCGKNVERQPNSKTFQATFSYYTVLAGRVATKRGSEVDKRGRILCGPRYSQIALP